MARDDHHRRLMLALLRANHEVGRACNRVYRRFGVTHHQVQILRILRHAGKPVVQGEIGEHLLVSRANLSGLIGRMVDAGLVRRKVTRRDRRVVLIESTDRGREVLQAVEPVRETVEAILFADLERDQAEQVSRLLESIAGNAEDIG